MKEFWDNSELESIQKEHPNAHYCLGCSTVVFDSTPVCENPNCFELWQQGEAQLQRFLYRKD